MSYGLDAQQFKQWQRHAVELRVTCFWAKQECVEIARKNPVRLLEVPEMIGKTRNTHEWLPRIRGVLEMCVWEKDAVACLTGQAVTAKKQSAEQSLADVQFKRKDFCSDSLTLMGYPPRQTIRIAESNARKTSTPGGERERERSLMG